MTDETGRPTTDRDGAVEPEEHATGVRGTVDRIVEGIAVILLDDGTQLEIDRDANGDPLAEGDTVEARRVTTWQVRRIEGESGENRAALDQRLQALRARSARFDR